jgi:sulfite exporter TauE/SafE
MIFIIFIIFLIWLIVGLICGGFSISEFDINPYENKFEIKKLNVYEFGLLVSYMMFGPLTLLLNFIRIGSINKWHWSEKLLTIKRKRELFILRKLES